jgi:cytochrome b
MTDAPATPAPVRRKVWDVPTRLFHWALVGTVLTGLYLGEYRSFSTIQLHFYFGYATGALILFRLLWGIVGPAPIRLSALFPSPRALFAYLRNLFARRPSGVAGHNPLGALSVLAMLVALSTQVITGLGAEDDGLFSAGPLAEYLSSSMVLKMTAIHHYSSRAVMALIVIHLAAILFYRLWKREDLVTAMGTGWKTVRRDTPDDTA